MRRVADTKPFILSILLRQPPLHMERAYSLICSLFASRISLLGLRGVTFVQDFVKETNFGLPTCIPSTLFTKHHLLSPLPQKTVLEKTFPHFSIFPKASLHPDFKVKSLSLEFSLIITLADNFARSLIISRFSTVSMYI